MSIFGTQFRDRMIWFIGRVAPLCAVLLPVAAASQDKFFDSNRVRIHYVDRETGEAVVLMHGQGSSLQEWIDSGVLQNLLTDYRVIALDCRGHGKSGKPHDPTQYGQEMGLDVMRLLDFLDIRRAHVVGYSMGAQITAQLLTLHPNRFLCKLGFKKFSTPSSKSRFAS